MNNNNVIFGNLYDLKGQSIIIQELPMDNCVGLAMEGEPLSREHGIMTYIIDMEGLAEMIDILQRSEEYLSDKIYFKKENNEHMLIAKPRFTKQKKKKIDESQKVMQGVIKMAKSLSFFYINIGVLLANIFMFYVLYS